MQGLGELSMDTLLSLSLALVCAWSQPHCDAAKKVTITHNAGIISCLGKSYPGARAAYCKPKASIQIASRFQQPAVVAGLLAGELNHVIDGLADCRKSEVDSLQATLDYWTWDEQTFGRIETSGTDLYNMLAIRESRPDDQVKIALDLTRNCRG